MPYREASSYLLRFLENKNLPRPSIGVICGSGLSGLSSTMENTHTISYGDIPGFPSHCTVKGHKGELVFGELSGVPTLCFRGRFHFYEGHPMQTVVLPIRILRCLGVKVVIITNAAGGLNPSYNVGDVICIQDHFSLPTLAGNNPLIGINDDELGPRFPATSSAYDGCLQDIVMNSATSLGLDFVRKDGVYCFVGGPTYESKCEARFLRSIGGDAVGMSTIPEIIAATHAGLKVVCLSLITNKVVLPDEDGPAATHAEVLVAVEQRILQMQSFVKEIVKNLNSFTSNLPDLPPVNLQK